jgi:hypothetical protein
MLGDMLDSGTGGHLQNGGGPLPEIRFRRVVAELEQFGFLLRSEADMMSARHHSILQGVPLSLQNPV